MPFLKYSFFIFLSLTFMQVAGSAPLALVTPAPQIQAKSWALYDISSKHMLLGHQVDQRIPPASITKLMTAYLVFSAIKTKQITLDQKVTVSENAWKMTGSRMFIEPNRPVTVEELIKGMIVQSGNDATVALAELISGTETKFVKQMNLQANQLGLKNTHYVNATGMPDPNHYSSARDIITLSAALIRDFPDRYAYYSMKEYRYNLAHPQYNRNRLLWLDPKVDGIKTGYTEEAGFCLVASKALGSRRLISVVLGATSDQARAQENQKLLNYGFLNFETLLLYKKGSTIATVPLYKGSVNEVAIGYGYDFYVTIPKGSTDKISAKLIRQHPLVAPVYAGQTVGTLQILLEGKPYVEYPVFALSPVGSAGWVGSLIDTIRLWFN